MSDFKEALLLKMVAHHIAEHQTGKQFNQLSFEEQEKFLLPVLELAIKLKLTKVSYVELSGVCPVGGESLDEQKVSLYLDQYDEFEEKATTEAVLAAWFLGIGVPVQDVAGHFLWWHENNKKATGRSEHKVYDEAIRRGRKLEGL
jgi:hypothetical protein